MDDVFKALADPTRRSLLDALFIQDGQTLGQLCERFSMTRFGVMKHLGLLEDAGLVVTRRRGREKQHFLNPVPIRLVHDRWVSKYAEPWAAALSDLKSQLEQPVTRVFEVYIRTSADQLWRAIAEPESWRRYGLGPLVATSWAPGSHYAVLDHDSGQPRLEGQILVVEPRERLIVTMRALWSEAVKSEGFSQVTWEIAPRGAVCHLTVTHGQLREGGAADLYEGWPFLLSSLKTWLETGEALEATADRPRAETSRRPSRPTRSGHGDHGMDI